MSVIPDDFVDLLNEKKAFAHVATKNEDGSLQSTPVWIEYDGEYVVFNTNRSRRKTTNLSERPETAISIHDPDNPYRYLEVRGTVERIEEENADEHIDKLSRRYIGEDYPYRQPGEVRVKVYVRPEEISFRD